MIAPNTTLILIPNIPFDNTYEHTVSYANREAQHKDLTSGDIITLSNLTYQCSGKNSIRVEKGVKDVLPYNYMCWKNTNYENKWWYAFITNVEYVNDNTTEIFYEIDVMQTFFLFDTTKEQSFIEREHSTTDGIGDNIVDEGIVNVGEYIFENYGKLESALDDTSVIIASCGTSNIGFFNFDNSFTGCHFKCFSSKNVSAIAQELTTFIQKPEEIVSIYIVPTLVVEGLTDSSGDISSGSVGNTFNLSATRITDTTPFGSNDDGTPAIPKNKKLYTYPYNFYHVDNGEKELNLRYEFFDNLKPEFECISSFTQPVQIVLYPTGYKLAQRRTSDTNFAEKLVLSNYPLCSFSYDSYKNWLATESVSIALNAIPSVINSVGAISQANAGDTSGAIGSGLTIVNYALNTINQAYKQSIKADVMRGGTNTSTAGIAHNLHNFLGSRVHITKEYMQIIDDYFTMFGYACKRVKHITYRNRPHFNYVKTRGANLTSKCGNLYTRKMCDILDRGITFWMDSKSKVCNYNLDNAPE